MVNQEDVLLKKVKETLLQDSHEGVIGFWGNRQDNLVEKTFSNFYLTNFSDEVIVNVDTGEKRKVTFSCSEQYFMYLKALHFKSQSVVSKIIEGGKLPKDYKWLGGKDSLDEYVDAEWVKVRFEYMKRVLRLKFSSNEQLRQGLVGTGNAVLVEASPFDKVWGIGLAKADKYGNTLTDWENPNKWRGRNLLGLALMEVREELK